MVIVIVSDANFNQQNQNVCYIEKGLFFFLVLDLFHDYIRFDEKNLLEPPSLSQIFSIFIVTNISQTWFTFTIVIDCN